jgi:hypothetical protein
VLRGCLLTGDVARANALWAALVGGQVFFLGRGWIECE